jgi:two-component system, chemotaxis family, sensor kinase CheA
MESRVRQNCLKVMIIDDDIGLLRLLETVIRNINLMPITASSAQEGLSMIAGGCLPDLVLLDIMMPSTCGFETYNRLRELENFQQIKIIAFTAYAHEWEKDRILKHGFDGYICKPFRKAEFIRIITQALLTNEDSGPADIHKASAYH